MELEINVKTEEYGNLFKEPITLVEIQQSLVHYLDSHPLDFDAQTENDDRLIINWLPQVSLYSEADIQKLYQQVQSIDQQEKLSQNDKYAYIMGMLRLFYYNKDMIYLSSLDLLGAAGAFCEVCIQDLAQYDAMLGDVLELVELMEAGQTEKEKYNLVSNRISDLNKTRYDGQFEAPSKLH